MRYRGALLCSLLTSTAFGKLDRSSIFAWVLLIRDRLAGFGELYFSGGLMARVDFKEIEKKLSSTKARPTLSVLRASYGIIAFVMIYWDIYAMKSIFI